MPRALAFWVLLRPPHAWVAHGRPVLGHQLDSLSKTPGARLKYSLPPAPAVAVGSLADAAPGMWLRGAWCALVSQSLAQKSRKQAGPASMVLRQATGRGSASLPLSRGGGGAAQGGAGARGVGEPGQGYRWPWAMGGRVLGPLTMNWTLTPCWPGWPRSTQSW